MDIETIVFIAIGALSAITVLLNLYWVLRYRRWVYMSNSKLWSLLDFGLLLTLLYIAHKDLMGQIDPVLYNCIAGAMIGDALVALWNFLHCFKKKEG